MLRGEEESARNSPARKRDEEGTARKKRQIPRRAKKHEVSIALRSPHRQQIALAALLHSVRRMWAVLGSAVDLIHALAMTLWLVGLPLLFMRRWPRARVAYAGYALGFIVLSQTSMVVLNECFLTTLARWCWDQGPAHRVSHEWFTVRISRFVFGMAPSHRVISRATEALVFVTAAGALVSVLRSRRQHRTMQNAA